MRGSEACWFICLIAGLHFFWGGGGGGGGLTTPLGLTVCPSVTRTCRIVFTLLAKSNSFLAAEVVAVVLAAAVVVLRRRAG